MKQKMKILCGGLMIVGLACTAESGTLLIGENFDSFPPSPAQWYIVNNVKWGAFRTPAVDDSWLSVSDTIYHGDSGKALILREKKTTESGNSELFASHTTSWITSNQFEASLWLQRLDTTSGAYISITGAEGAGNYYNNRNVLSVNIKTNGKLFYNTVDGWLDSGYSVFASTWTKIHWVVDRRIGTFDLYVRTDSTSENRIVTGAIASGLSQDLTFNYFYLRPDAYQSDAGEQRMAYDEMQLSTLDPKTQAPFFLPAGPEIIGETLVTISSVTADAKIYYTTDGSTPTTSGTAYSNPTTVVLRGKTLVRAIAVANDISYETSQTYVPAQATAPEFLPSGRYISGPTEIMIHSDMAGASIYYTLDGSMPTSDSMRYTEPVRVKDSVTLRAVTIADNYAPSSVTSTSYVQTIRDLTFCLWSDSHFGSYDFDEYLNDSPRLSIMEDINNLSGVFYPRLLDLGWVDKPVFLLHLGDVTEDGYASQWDSPTLADQRSYIQTIKHLDPEIQRYEALGNHDARTEVIQNAIAARHGNTYYSFDLQGVHFVVLDPFKQGGAYPGLDDTQLAWLGNDLNRLNPQMPILIAMHILPDPDLTSTDYLSHLDADSSQKLANIIADKNVLAFVHGHWHRTSKRTWGNLDVLGTGFNYTATGCPNGTPTFLVIRITDNHFYAVEYNWNNDDWSETLLDKTFEAVPPASGDANLDGLVDVGDLSILAANYGTTSGAIWSQGDFNHDSLVDVGDLSILAANYSTGSSAALDFSSDYARVLGSSETDTDSTVNALCSGLGLPLILSLVFMGWLFIKEN
jgi:hypothetical protein